MEGSSLTNSDCFFFMTVKLLHLGRMTSPSQKKYLDVTLTRPVNWTKKDPSQLNRKHYFLCEIFNVYIN